MEFLCDTSVLIAHSNQCTELQCTIKFKYSFTTQIMLKIQLHSELNHLKYIFILFVTTSTRQCPWHTCSSSRRIPCRASLSLSRTMAAASARMRLSSTCGAARFFCWLPTCCTGTAYIITHRVHVGMLVWLYVGMALRGYGSTWVWGYMLDQSLDDYDGLVSGCLASKSRVLGLGNRFLTRFSTWRT